MSSKEERIRTITQFYYSKPEVQKAILDFAKDREVVPRYFEGFGKRPDVLQYGSDVIGLVKKGATSFHGSEELWDDALRLNSDLLRKEMDELRKDWDLLIDVDSKYLDVSKILTKLIIKALEEHGIKNYGVKFSGSKGFHIIVSGKAFPNEYDGVQKKLMFPEWPRAICGYLMYLTRREFNREINQIFGEKGVEKNLGDSAVKEALCPICEGAMKKGGLVVLKCPLCETKIERKDMKITKKRLKCIQDNCAGVFEIEDEKEYFQCENCGGVSTINKMETSGRGVPVFEKFAKQQEHLEGVKEEHAGASHGMADLVLVAPRHLFRMPYSLHEKTSLVSVVLGKDEIDNFTPQDASPMKIKIINFMPNNFEGEARRLLSAALEWRAERDAKEKEVEEKRYKGKKFEVEDLKDISEDMFPAPIKKLLKGLEDGRKRGLFVLLTFLRNVGFSPEEISNRIRVWNEKNQPPLKEGYVRSQIEWNFKQNKKILPPNYNNDSFYRDLGLFKEKPKTKNPLVDVKRELWKRKGK